MIIRLCQRPEDERVRSFAVPVCCRRSQPVAWRTAPNKPRTAAAMR